MEKTVTFRRFEERDIDFIYKCKNDEKLNSMVVGNWKPLTYDESAQWVRNCMKGDRPDLRFWAIATNDEEQRIIGWVSLSKINRDNRSACFHGIVIGDPQYRDGTAWIESFLFLYHYVFVENNFNRLYGSCLTENKASLFMTEAMLEKVEGIARQAIYRDGKYYDIMYGAILREDYLTYISNGEFEINKILKRLLVARKTMISKYSL